MPSTIHRAATLPQVSLSNYACFGAGADVLLLRWFHQTDSTKQKCGLQEPGTEAHTTIGNFTKLWLPYIMHTHVRIRRKQYKLTFSVMNSVKYKHINNRLLKLLYYQVKIGLERKLKPVIRVWTSRAQRNCQAKGVDSCKSGLEKGAVGSTEQAV